MAHPLEAPVCPILDTPKPWLVQLILTVALSDYAALLQCCKPLRDLVRSTVKSVKLSIYPHSTEPSQQLITACKPGVVLQLVVSGRQDTYRRQCALEYAIQHPQGQRDKECWDVNTHFLQQLFTQANAAARPNLIGVPPLYCVTRLTLQGDVKGAIVPSCVMSACPNLLHFTRPGSFEQLSFEPTATEGGPHLRTLHFTDIDIKEPSSLGITTAWQLQAQLQAQLFTLKTLKLDGLDSTIMSQKLRRKASWWARLLEPLHKHVTSLHMVGLWVLEPVGNPLPSAWQAVKQVHLSCGVSPHDVCLLLRAVPHLAQLDVSEFEVGDYSSCRGSWRQVQLSIREPMTMGQLGCLPLSWVRSLRFNSLRIAATTRPVDVERARQNLAAHKDTVTISTLLAASHMPLQVRITAPAALLPAVVSVLHLLQPARLRVLMPADTLLPPAHACVVEPLVDMSGMRSVKPARLLLPKGFSLFRELPHMHMLELAFGGYDTIDSQQLMAVLKAVCSQATGSAVLSVREQAAEMLLGPSWRVQLGAAMRAAGHEHIWLQGHVHRP